MNTLYLSVISIKTAFPMRQTIVRRITTHINLIVIEMEEGDVCDTMQQVPIDIKPQSCPNPLNKRSKGVLPLAIVGTDSFDVTQVDPTSVKLEGVSPLRYSQEDVAMPFEPFMFKDDAYDCNTAGPDGYLDFTFKFNTQEIVAALGSVTDKGVKVLQITGNLLEEYGGMPIIGEDVVIILTK